MSIVLRLREEAEQVGMSMQSRLDELDREIQQKTDERAQLVAERNYARLAAQRVEKYPVVHGSNLLCPYCWVGRGRLATLAPVDGDVGTLRCVSCLTELVADVVIPTNTNHTQDP